MSDRPPKTYSRFVDAHPGLGKAWDAVREAELEGPLDEQMRRLVKLAVAAGAMREGAVHSAVRKARAAGVTEDAIAQVVALSASTLGMPATVAVFSWLEDDQS